MRWVDHEEREVIFDKVLVEWIFNRCFRAGFGYYHPSPVVLEARAQDGYVLFEAFMLTH